MKETVKKLVCMIAVITIVFAVPGVASANENVPSGDDFRISVEHSGAVYVNIYTSNYDIVYRGYITNNESVNVTAPFGDVLMLSAEYDFTGPLQPYFQLISSASNVWVSYAFEFTQVIDPMIDEAWSLIWCNYDNGNGFQQFLLDEYPLSGMAGVFDGNHITSPIDIADVFRGGGEFDYLQIAQRINISTSPSKMYDYQFIPKAMSLIVYLQGVSGSDANMFLVVDSGIKNLDASIQQVKDEVKVIQGQLDNIQSDINTGFDNVTGAINGAGADTSGMDNGMAQLGGQLGDLGDVEDQLGGLIMDKVEVPDLILTNDQGSALALLVSCLNLAYVDLRDYQVMFASVLFFGIIGVLLFGRRNL